MPELPRQYPVLGFPVHILSNYSDWLATRIGDRLGTHVVTLNAEMVMQAEANPDLAKAIRQAELVIPDGSGVVLYLYLHGQQGQRCPGIELAEALLRRSAASATQPWSVVFYGGAPGVADTAANRWQQQLPDLNLVMVQHGYHSAESEAAFRQQLQALQPQLILVGLGVPRQEHWIANNRHLCPNSTWIGVGGSFDIWAGKKTRAPRWLKENHLEWVYRLYQEPWRWRRMMALPKFAWRALLARFSQATVR